MAAKQSRVEDGGGGRRQRASAAMSGIMFTSTLDFILTASHQEEVRSDLWLVLHVGRDVQSCSASSIGRSGFQRARAV